ncbi:citrate synthase [Candidatus Nitrosoglobus terrae]|uniref:Citrate synthase n=2 Tax=Candidatus Nitrosoglobus terrae TaxID=1630141 RepID=A0A1Q2SMF7_9GAMM|nr:citrate synthase [Candidatus Nitrosoglobus terrae]
MSENQEINHSQIKEKVSHKQEVIHSQIWEEIPEKNNPFAAAGCYCCGYDVYGDLLDKVSWIEYLYLLFKQDRPTAEEAKLLEGLAIAIANPGPRDYSVRAAMCAGVGGSTYASALIAALGVGAGQYSGSREVGIAMAYWQECGTSLVAWQERLKHLPQEERADVWLPIEHPPGFDLHGVSCATPVQQTLTFLVKFSSSGALAWLQTNQLQLENAADCPLAMTGVIAAAMIDLGFSIPQGEMLYLLLRLPGAAVHALEQEKYGWRRYPFFAAGLELENASAVTN